MTGNSVFCADCSCWKSTHSLLLGAYNAPGVSGRAAKLLRHFLMLSQGKNVRKKAWWKCSNDYGVKSILVLGAHNCVSWVERNNQPCTQGIFSRAPFNNKTEESKPNQVCLIGRTLKVHHSTAISIPFSAENRKNRGKQVVLDLMRTSTDTQTIFWNTGPPLRSMSCQACLEWGLLMLIHWWSCPSRKPFLQVGRGGWRSARLHPLHFHENHLRMLFKLWIPFYTHS